MSETIKLLGNPSPAAKQRERGLVSRMLRSGGLLTASRIASKLLALATMSVLAHHLSEQDMGVAMTLLAGVALVEMLGEIGFDQRLLQLDEGEATGHLPSIQAVLLLRGLGAAALLCVVAYPLGVGFGFGEDRLAFFAVALVPLARSVRNVQIVIRQRRLDFRAYALAEILPELAAIAFVVPIVHMFEGYQAVVAIAYLRSAIVILVSHVLATEPYRLDWNRSSVRGLLDYGWPLTINGLLIYGSIQGDRLIVASAFDMANMAAYSLASTYAFLPSLAVNSLLQRLFLPLLVGQQNPERFHRRYGVIRGVCGVAGLSFFALFLLIGPHGVEFLMSNKYENIYSITLLLSLAAGIRTLRCSHVIPLLASGQTRTVLWGSLARCTGLICAAVFAICGQDLLWIAVSAIVGELFAAVVSIAVVRRSLSIPHCTMSRELLPFVTSAALLGITHCLFDRHLPVPLVSAMLFAGILCMMVWRSFVMLKRD